MFYTYLSILHQKQTSSVGEKGEDKRKEKRKEKREEKKITERKENQQFSD